MDGENTTTGAANGRCPRCELCGGVVRVRGVGREGVWCAGCLMITCASANRITRKL